MKMVLRFVCLSWLFVVALAWPARGDKEFFPNDFEPKLDVSLAGDGDVQICDLNDTITGLDSGKYKIHVDLPSDTLFEVILRPNLGHPNSPDVLVAVDGKKVFTYSPEDFTPPPAPHSPNRAAFRPGAQSAAAKKPVTIPVSNDGDSFAMTPDGRYLIVVGSNGPISLVDLVAGQEVGTLAIAGTGTDNYPTYASLCDDGATVLVIIRAAAIHRLTFHEGTLVDNPETFPLPANAFNFMKVRAVAGSKVGVALVLLNGTSTVKLMTFSIPEMQLIDSVALSSGSPLDGIVVSPDGTKVYARSNGVIDAFTLDPLTGELGDTPLLTIPNVSPARLGSFFGDAIDITSDGAYLVASESANPSTATVPTPRITLFDTVTGARAGFIPFDQAPTLVSLGPPPVPRGVNTAAFKKGDPAPGADGSAGKPPANALLASFGVPAIDDAGHLAFTATWTSAPKAKGSGLFTNQGCIAIVGGPVPGAAGVTFKSFSDPLIAGGHVAFGATASGVPKAGSSLVLSDAATGTLEVVAQSGAAAPGAGDARFKTFKGTAIAGSSVAVLAQLTGGMGMARVSKANDLGLWMKDSSHALTLVLREGDMIGALHVKTLVSFAVGNGSPGQGRGWLRTDGTTPQALALVIFDDKSQAVVSATFDTVTIESQSGPGGMGAPEIVGATFASYGPPAANAVNDIAFAGSMTANFGGVLKADAHGIFASNAGGTFTPIARVTGLVDPANATGPAFSVLKDPVLASDGAVAFPATLTGGGLKGLAHTALCYQPAGGALALLAQGGQPPPGLSGSAQFKAFTSLAVADTGPLFSASLAVGKGGVTAANANGVWGADAHGVTRLLFRAGDMIGQKKVTRFTALSAVPGSLGTTHSFNASGHVAWRATFTDKSTAIITTEAP